MKSITKFSLLFLVVIFFFNCSSEQEKFLEIDGKTIGTDTKSIILLKPDQDLRHDSIIEIPVINGKFYYKAKIEHPEGVNLFLTKNGRRFMTLFLENEKIDLTIYPEEEFDKNIVIGGKLNAEYKKYRNGIDSKFKPLTQPLEDSLNILKNKYKDINNEMSSLNTKLAKTKDKSKKNTIQIKLNTLQKELQDLISKANGYEKKRASFYDDSKVFQHEYMKSNNTIVSYYFLLKDLTSYLSHKKIYNKETIDINLAKNTLETLKKTFPDHPYNEFASNLIYTIENVKVGKKYIDFSAPDLNGNIIKLSDKIKGKVALLDLWATWCGPCIRKSRSMIPVYNEYKDKGFTVVGVAGEFKNTDNLVKFLNKEKWEWLNLVELKIWQKYGVGNSGGGVFLIDKNGIIIAKDPTTEEVQKELEARLK